MTRVASLLSARQSRLLKAGRNLFVDPPPRRRRLVIEDVSAAGQEVSLVFSDRARRFVHKLRFGRWSARTPVAGVVDERLGTALGLLVAPHLFVLTDFEAVEVKTGALTPEQKEFWGWYLQHGLAQFRYQSGLDPRRAIDVIAPVPPGADMAAVSPRVERIPREVRRAILLNGGGKDTAVAAELCKRVGIEFDWLTVAPTQARLALMAASMRPSMFEATFHLDAALQERARYSRRHVPYFALFLMAGVLAAVAGGYDAVIAGNERSADEGNLFYHGFPVNHQFSKSSSFERQFQHRVVESAGLDLHTFSILRPFSEIRLAQLFTQLEQYLTICVSCNRLSHASRWCLNCPKCAFVSLAYGAFMDDDSLEAVFGELPFNRPGIRRQWVSLVVGSSKPWECVGTREECRLALRLFLDRRPGLRLDGRPGVEALRELVSEVDVNRSSQLWLSDVTLTSGMPPAIESLLQSAANSIVRP